MVCLSIPPARLGDILFGSYKLWNTSHFSHSIFPGDSARIFPELAEIIWKRDPQKISPSDSGFSSIHDALSGKKGQAYLEIKSVRREIQGLTAHCPRLSYYLCLGRLRSISGTRTLIHVPQNLKNAGGLQITFRDRQWRRIFEQN